MWAVAPESMYQAPPVPSAASDGAECRAAKEVVSHDGETGSEAKPA